jgi:hypothetical protein
MAKTQMHVRTVLSVVPQLPAAISVLFRGNHGIGKSQVVAQLRNLIKESDPNLGDFPLIDRRLSQLTEGDIIGLPSTDGEVTRFNPPTVTVLNAGAKEGTARKLGGELYRYGFNVINTRNYGPKGSPTFEKSFVAIHPGLKMENDETASMFERSSLTSDVLAKILKISIGTTPDVTPFEKDQANIVIVLGKDFEYTPLQELL